MKYAIVFRSLTGNTSLIAETIRQALPASDCMYYGSPSPDALQADTLFLGFWTDKGMCDDVMKDFLTTLHQKNIYLFGTAGFGGSKEYFDTILSNVKSLLPPDNTVKSSFMCQGKMPVSIRSRYEKILSADPDNEKMKQLIENFDLALTHPDKADQIAAADWAKSYR